jgi:hypothetical protein
MAICYITTGPLSGLVVIVFAIVGSNPAKDNGYNGDKNL